MISHDTKRLLAAIGAGQIGSVKACGCGFGPGFHHWGLSRKSTMSLFDQSGGEHGAHLLTYVFVIKIEVKIKIPNKIILKNDDNGVFK